VLQQGHDACDTRLHNYKWQGWDTAVIAAAAAAASAGARRVLVLNHHVFMCSEARRIQLIRCAMERASFNLAPSFAATSAAVSIWRKNCEHEAALALVLYWCILCYADTFAVVLMHQQTCNPPAAALLSQPDGYGRRSVQCTWVLAVPSSRNHAVMHPTHACACLCTRTREHEGAEGIFLVYHNPCQGRAKSISSCPTVLDMR